MSYSVERLRDSKAILVTFHEDFDLLQEMPMYYAEVFPMLDNEPEPVTTIVNLLEFSFSINDLLGITKQLQGVEMHPSHHAMSKQTVMVSNNSMMRLSMEGFRKFGIVNEFHVVTSLDKALEIADSNLTTINSA